MGPLGGISVLAGGERHSEKATGCKPGGELSPGIQSVGTLILYFSASRPRDTNSCCLSHLVCGVLL